MLGKASTGRFCVAELRAQIGDILLFNTDQTLDDDAKRVVGEAYDHARQLIGDIPQPLVLRQTIAKSIIGLVSGGERDPEVIARLAVQEMV
jgi:hypothetical protein